MKYMYMIISIFHSYLKLEISSKLKKYQNDQYWFTTIALFLFTLRFFWHFVNEALFQKGTTRLLLFFLTYCLSAVTSYDEKRLVLSKNQLCSKFQKVKIMTHFLTKTLIWNMATALIKDQPLKAEELERLSETSLAFVKEALSLEENGLESSVSCLSSLIRSSPNFP